MPLDSPQSVELHIFSDASELAISAVAYVFGVLTQSKQVSFLMGKSKVAPLSGTTIPRLELCAAVLGVEMKDAILKHIGLTFSVTKFYTNSRVVLGYINNQSRRFYTYVGNRALRIRQSSSPQQWNYVCSSLNPADVGSRGSDPDKLRTKSWFTGPSFLYNLDDDIPEFFPLIHPNSDSEIRPVVQVLATSTKVGLGPFNWIERFERFSSWENLIQAISVLKRVATSIVNRCHVRSCIMVVFQLRGLKRENKQVCLYCRKCSMTLTMRRLSVLKITNQCLGIVPFVL